MHFQPTSPLIPILLGKEKDVRYLFYWYCNKILASLQEITGMRTVLEFDFFSNVSKLFRHFCSYAFLWIFGIWSPFLSISLASKYRGSLPFVISQFTISQFMIPMILFQASISWIPRCFMILNKSLERCFSGFLLDFFFRL